MYIALTEQELDALRGRDYGLTVLYLWLKSYMDYKTLIVGYSQRISYQAMSEALYIEPRAGVKGGSPHLSTIRRMIDQLLNCGILLKGRQDTLVFKLPFAQTDFHVQNKADRKSTPQADTVEPTPVLDSSYKADRGKKAKADTPHLSLNTINKAAAAKHYSNNDANISKTAAAAEFIFNPKLEVEQQALMLTSTEHLKPAEQQMLFDELSGFISNNKITSTPMKFFITLVKQQSEGTLEPIYARKVKALRENPPSAIIKPAEPTEAEKQANQQKGREAMQAAKAVLTKRKVA